MDKESFLTRVRVDESGCWIWTGPVNNHRMGYGSVQIAGRTHRAHRVAYTLFKGPIPAGKFVCHSCDNPPCVNPDHLWLGSHQQNVDDAVRKGRNSKPPILRGDDNPSRKYPEKRKRGEGHPLAKATAATVTAIRLAYLAGERRADMTERFGVKPTFLDDVIYGRVWRHLFGVDGSPTLDQLRAAKRERPGAKVTREIAEEIRNRLSKGETGKDLATEYGIHKATVSDIRQRKIWR